MDVQTTEAEAELRPQSLNRNQQRARALPPGERAVFGRAVMPEKGTVARPDGTIRLTWPEVATILAVFGFTAFLVCRGMPVHLASLQSVGTTAAVLTLVALPRRIAEAVKLLRGISQSVTPADTAEVPR